jgi:ABC-type proline/glycine betaine transport system ATPase subunit
MTVKLEVKSLYKIFGDQPDKAFKLPANRARLEMSMKSLRNCRRLAGTPAGVPSQAVV